MRINHNLTGLSTLRQLTINEANQSKTMQELSTGKRINSAADDAAGYAISTRMENQIRGLTQATTNAQNGISLVQTATGALSQTSDILQRMRELAVNGSTDTTTADDRQQMQKEMDQLSKQISTISNTTTFNGKNLLAGGFTNQQIQTGANAGESIQMDIGAFDAKSLGLTAAAGATVTNGTSVNSATAVTSATKASVTGGVVNNLSGVASGDTINVTVDGTSATLTLSGLPANATMNDLVKDINTQITGSTLKGQLTASLDSTGTKLVFNDLSSKTGSSSTLAVYSSNANLGMGSGAGTALTGTGTNAISSIATGQYTVDGTVTTAATKATASGGALNTTSFAINAGDTLSLAVDGGEAVKINLTAATSGTYGSTSDLANAIQQQINNTSLNGKVSVSDNGSGALMFTDLTSNAGTQSSLVVSSNNSGLLNGAGTAVPITGAGTNASVSLNLKDSAGNVLATQSVTGDQKTGSSTASFANGLSVNLNQSTLTSTGSLNATTLDIVAKDSTAATTGPNGQVTANATVEKGILIDTQANASNAIKTIDNAINSVNSVSATLGAVQNRFQDTINTLGTTSQNLTSAESQITDVDMATAVMENSKNSILTQAAQAMLAQSKSQPQSVLQLLQG